MRFDMVFTIRIEVRPSQKSSEIAEKSSAKVSSKRDALKHCRNLIFAYFWTPQNDQKWTNIVQKMRVNF